MRENGHDDWKATMGRAQELLDQGRKEMAKAAEIAREKGEDALIAARKRGQEVWDEARANGMNTIDDLRDQGEEIWDDAQKAIKKHPARAIGFSILVGLVIGAFLSKDKE